MAGNRLDDSSTGGAVVAFVRDLCVNWREYPEE